jgi:hypothetical protein
MVVLEGGERSALSPDRFTLNKTAPGAYWIGDNVGHKDGLGVMEKKKILPLRGIKSRPSNP